MCTPLRFSDLPPPLQARMGIFNWIRWKNLCWQRRKQKWSKKCLHESGFEIYTFKIYWIILHVMRSSDSIKKSMDSFTNFEFQVFKFCIRPKSLFPSVLSICKNQNKYYIIRGRKWLHKIGWASSNAAHRPWLAAPSILPETGWAITNPAHPPLKPL